MQLGRFVLVFCCDENFDFQAMGRIFVGLCQVGAWGCFDEFNRLDERMLSAVSQQIQNIQEGLLAAAQSSGTEIDIVGRKLRLHPRTGRWFVPFAHVCLLPLNLYRLLQVFSSP
jgi:dynein heavy chain 1